MSNSRLIAWSVWIIASIFYAYQYILRVIPSAMFEDIMQQFRMDATIFGQFAGLYYIGYNIMPIPIAIMLDRYGPRRVLTACILLTVIGLMPIIFAENWVYPVIGRIMIGTGSTAAILGIFKIVRMTFSERHFTRMLSLSVTIGLIGAIYGGAPVSSMCKSLGYKAVVEIFIVSGLILAAITYLIMPDVESTRHNTVASDIKTIFTNKKAMLLCVFAGCMVGPLEGFADVWGSEFLKLVYGFEASAASRLPSMIFVGMCFGAPVLSMIAEKTGGYIECIIAAGAIMFAIFAVLVIGALNLSAMTISFVIVGVCCSYQIIAIYKATTFVPENVTALTTAVANMIIMSFGYAFHSVIGYVVNIYGGVGAKAAFVYGISVIPAALAIGVVGFVMFFIGKEKGA
jgi:predicted MFS family arabinose efflux permease